MRFAVTDDVRVLYRAQEVLFPDRKDGVRYNWTTFRHLFVHKCKEAGMDYWKVVAIVGHSDSKLIREVYGNWGDVEAGRALEELYGE